MKSFLDTIKQTLIALTINVLVVPMLANDTITDQNFQIDFSKFEIMYEILNHNFESP